MTPRPWAVLFPILALACEGEPEDDTSTTGCREEALDLCAYASPELAFTEKNAQVTDDVTGRVLPVRIRIPEGEGPFSVVVYAHGGGFNDTGHVFGAQWGEALASHGYVTVNIGHSVPTGEMVPTLCALAGVPEGECNTDLLDEDSGMVGLVKRFDVVGVLDALPGFAEFGVEHGGPPVDTDRFAVIGWSAGSRATMAAHGAGIVPSASAPVYAVDDPRIATIVAFSPTGPGFGGFFADDDGSSWDTMGGPSLMVTGDNDVKTNNPDLTGPVRRAAYENQPADGQRRLLYSRLPVGVGGHDTYNLDDLESTDDRLVRLSLALRSVTRAHLDATFRDDPAARAYLDSDDPRILAGEADWESR